MRQALRVVPATVVITFFFVSTITMTGLASNYGGRRVQSTSGKVLINFFSNYDYFSRELPFRYVHEVEGLDIVRRSLVQDRLILDVPIVINERFPGDAGVKSPPVARFSLEHNCGVYDREFSEGPTYIGKCYLLQMADDIRHWDLVALILSLPHLPKTKPITEVPDLGSLHRARLDDIHRFRSIVQHFDPIWSPSGTHLLYTEWRDGQVRIRLLDVATRQIEDLEPLRGYLAVQPVWSADSRYIAYASLQEIRIFDRGRRAAKTIPLPPRICCESLVYFRMEKHELAFSYDTGMLSNYQIYSYDLAGQAVREEARDSIRPPWDKGWRRYLDWESYLSIREVVSPTGTHVAMITMTNGLRRLEISRRR